MQIQRNVLFLCTGNSARSQIAEGLVNHRLTGWRAWSAGVAPTGKAHPCAVHVMAEIGIDITGQYSKSVDVFHNQAFDVVITLCDHAAATCPVWLGAGARVHLGFPDPASGSDDPTLQLPVFRQVRDAIAEKVVAYLAHWHPTAPVLNWLTTGGPLDEPQS